VTSYVTLKSQTPQISQKNLIPEEQKTLEEFPVIEAPSSDEPLRPQTLDEPNTGSSFQ